MNSAEIVISSGIKSDPGQSCFAGRWVISKDRVKDVVYVRKICTFLDNLAYLFSDSSPQCDRGFYSMVY